MGIFFTLVCCLCYVPMKEKKPFDRFESYLRRETIKLILFTGCIGIGLLFLIILSKYIDIHPILLGILYFSAIFILVRYNWQEVLRIRLLSKLYHG